MDGFQDVLLTLFKLALCNSASFRTEVALLLFIQCDSGFKIFFQDFHIFPINLNFWLMEINKKLIKALHLGFGCEGYKRS